MFATEVEMRDKPVIFPNVAGVFLLFKAGGTD
jgi:hypothetical protein